MKLNHINYLEALVFTACQSQTKDKSLYYIHDEKGSPVLLADLVAKARNEAANPDHFEAGGHLIKSAFKTLQPALENDLRKNSGIILKIKQIWWRLWGSEYAQAMQIFLRDKIETLDLVKQFTDPNLPELDNAPCYSYHLALCEFMKNFNSLFGTTPNPLKGGEISAFFLVAERIWNSSNVQQHEGYAKQYEAFENLLSEHVIGSHMLFKEESEETSLAKQIMNAVGIDNEKPGSVRHRISSHYGSIGSEQQHHIEGSLFPEWLFHTGHLAYHIDDKSISTHEGKARYFHYFDRHYQGKLTSNHRKTLFTWSQNENTPDGPRIIDLLWHRCIDVVYYWFLNNILHAERPQIAKYTSKKLGRGLPDRTPIIIHPPVPKESTLFFKDKHHLKIAPQYKTVS